MIVAAYFWKRSRRTEKHKGLRRKIERLARTKKRFRRASVKNREAREALRADGDILRAKIAGLEAAQQAETLARRTAEQDLAALRSAHDFSPHLAEPFRAFLRLLKPKAVVGFEKKRIGSLADGGYVMIDDFADVTHALSAGIGDDVSWDLDMARRGIKVIQLDHTVAGPPSRHENFDFRPQKVIGDSGEEQGATLVDLIGKVGAEPGRLICKMDIEGGEWQALAATPVASLQVVRQVVIEFHRLRHFVDPDWRAAAEGVLRKLTTSHQCVHVHGNNAVEGIMIGGIPFPDIFEATFVLRSAYRFSASDETFPTPIDRPNLPQRADTFIGTMDY